MAQGTHPTTLTVAVMPRTAPRVEATVTFDWHAAWRYWRHHLWVLAIFSGIVEWLYYGKPWRVASIGMVVVAVSMLLMLAAGYLAKLMWLRLRVWWVLKGGLK